MTVHFVSTAEAARLLRLSPDTVVRRIKAGQITAVKLVKGYRVRADLLGGAR